VRFGGNVLSGRAGRSDAASAGESHSSESGCTPAGTSPLSLIVVTVRIPSRNDSQSPWTAAKMRRTRVVFLLLMVVFTAGFGYSAWNQYDNSSHVARVAAACVAGFLMLAGLLIIVRWAKRPIQAPRPSSRGAGLAILAGPTGIALATAPASWKFFWFSVWCAFFLVFLVFLFAVLVRMSSQEAADRLNSQRPRTSQ
jgi:hypothetical protein